MATFTFDITEKVKDFVGKTITPMAGNPGQEVLIEKMLKDSYGQINVNVTLEGLEVVDISTDGWYNWRSNHPEAISIIMKEAEDLTDLFTDQAEIPGPWDIEDAKSTGNWKVVGWDQ
jgi:hypothetical protein